MSSGEYFELTELQAMPWLEIALEKIRADAQEIEMAEKLLVNSIEYRKGSFVVLSMSELGFDFGKIACIIRDDPQIPLLVLTVYSTVCFHSTSFSYQVVQKMPQDFRVCALSELLDYHPLDGIYVGGHMHIRLKYFLMASEQPTV